MPARADISHLSEVEQEKIRRRREIGRRCAANTPKEIIKARREKVYEDLREMDKTNPRWVRLLASNRDFKNKNPSKIAEYERRAGQNNPEHKLRRSLRTRFRQALKKNYKTGSAVADLGCSIRELKIHFETLFQEGMSWDNHGSVWHIDHKKPLASFDLQDRVQLLQAVHWTNLQPLFGPDNLKKGSKW